jgi:hypothetical protein
VGQASRLSQGRLALGKYAASLRDSKPPVAGSIGNLRLAVELGEDLSKKGGSECDIPSRPNSTNHYERRVVLDSSLHPIQEGVESGSTQFLLWAETVPIGL